jgi:hypothetical protein
VCRAGYSGAQSAVHVLAVSDLQNHYEDLPAAHLVDHPIRAHSDPEPSVDSQIRPVVGTQDPASPGLPTLGESPVLCGV